MPARPARRVIKRLRHGAGPHPDLPLIRAGVAPRRFDGHCFIAGLHRSGTTLLEQHLRAICDVSTLRAPVPENEGQHLQDVVPAAREHGGPGRFAFAPEMHTPPPPQKEIAATRDRLLSCWTPWVEGHEATLLEKSPPNLVRLPWLRTLFPGARFIVMTRDPRAVAAATEKWSGTSIEEMIFHWHVAHSSALGAGGPDCFFLRYEDFCADPAARLKDLVSALDLPVRASPRPVDHRFVKVANTNAKYLARQPRRVFGSGVWTELGYDLTS